MFENPRRGRQAGNFRTNVRKILDLKSSFEQIFSRKLTLGAPVAVTLRFCVCAKFNPLKIEAFPVSCFWFLAILRPIQKMLVVVKSWSRQKGAYNRSKSGEEGYIRM